MWDFGAECECATASAMFETAILVHYIHTSKPRMLDYCDHCTVLNVVVWSLWMASLALYMLQRWLCIKCFRVCATLIVFTLLFLRHKSVKRVTCKGWIPTRIGDVSRCRVNCGFVFLNALKLFNIIVEKHCFQL